MWLLANGHETGATEVFKKIAKSNKKNVDLEKSLALLNDIDSQNGTKKVKFRISKLKKKFFLHHEK